MVRSDPAPIASSRTEASFVDLALDPEGRPHIAYSVLTESSATVHIAALE